MLPIRDSVESERTPFVNYAIIFMCVVGFLFQLQSARDAERVVRDYGMIPFRVIHPSEKQILVEAETDSGRIQQHVVEFNSTVPPWMTIVTCLFLHGGLMHIVGNMWFLYIFGDNVEDRFGHLGYAVMYLISGLSANLMHIAADPDSLLPTIGASGAIAGVMGAYLLLYPGAVVLTLIPFGIFSRLVPIPAPLFLGLWFLFQILSGFLTSPSAGGVAWWAHVGGFLAGLGMTSLLINFGRLDRSRR